MGRPERCPEEDVGPQLGDLLRAQFGQHQLPHPDSFWDIVLGSGYRATIDALSRNQRDQVRQRLLAQLRSRNITAMRTDVIFGTAKRPG